MFPIVRSKKSLRSSIHLTIMSVLAFVIGFFMSYDAATMQNAIIDHHDVKEKNSDSPPPVIPSTTLELLGTISINQKQSYNKILPPEYGRFSNIFNIENLDTIFQLSPLSKKRLMRKLMMKILIGRIHRGKKEDYVNENGGPVFHWVTAGDSAAAGHGNSFSQSYTSILQDTVEDVFNSAGIKFVATNHAGDAWSGMELALCMESIFGRDVDVLSWDFMRQIDTAQASYEDPLSPSQGLDPLFFGERAGLVLPHLPFLFFLDLFSDGGAWDKVQKLEISGLGTGIMGSEALRELILKFPDFNKENGRNAAVAINRFHCGEFIEGKEMCNVRSNLYWCNSRDATQCANARFRAEDACRTSRYQTPWNDGWRMHLLKGRLLGFYLIEMLRMAAVELDILEQQHPQFRTNPLDALDVLRADGEVEEFLFSKTRPSRIHNEGRAILESWNKLKQKDAICLNAKAASMTPQKVVLPKFVSDPAQGAMCQDFLPFQNVYFQLDREDGWVTIDPLTVSHQSIPEKKSVAVGLCFKHCYGHQCVENPSSRNEYTIDWDYVEINFNGKQIADMKQVGGCYFLQSNAYLVWHDDSSSGLKIRNIGDPPLLLSSAFILY